MLQLDLVVSVYQPEVQNVCIDIKELKIPVIKLIIIFVLEPKIKILVLMIRIRIFIG